MSRPHYLLLLIGGLCYAFDGMDSAVVAFLMPGVREVFSLEQTQLGIIAPGALGDLVLLDGNPIERVSAISEGRPRAVVQGGRIVMAV